MNAAGGTVSYALPDVNTWTAKTFTVPSNFTNISVSVKNGNGRVYMDNIFGYFDGGTADNSAPVVQLINIENGAYTLSLYDNSPLLIREISVKIDGKIIPHSYNSATGTLIFNVADLSVPHRISVTAVDFFGNKSKAGFDYAPESYSISFKDMENNWAKSYIHVLTENKIFSPSDSFNPNQKASNAMVATMIYRSLSLNVSQYAKSEEGR